MKYILQIYVITYKKLYNNLYNEQKKYNDVYRWLVYKKTKSTN